MNGSIGRIDAIARLSARETFRSRSMLIAAILNIIILVLLAILAIAVLSRIPPEALTGLNTAAAREEAVRVVLLTAMGLASLMATFVGLFASVGAIANEIERGTILAVAARPVARWEILIGKFLGNSLLSVLYLVVQMIAIGVAMFVLTGVWTNDLLVSLALLSLNILVVVAVSLAGSTRLTMMANAISISVLLFALSNTGLIYLIGTTINEPLLTQAADWLRFLLPVSPVSDLAGTILAGSFGEAIRRAGGEVALPIRDWVWIYAAVYLIGAVALGCWSLSRRELR